VKSIDLVVAHDGFLCITEINSDCFNILVHAFCLGDCSIRVFQSVCFICLVFALASTSISCCSSKPICMMILNLFVPVVYETQL